MTVYLTSDLHFGHKRVSEIRGFATTHDHDNAIYESLDQLRKGDDLWILGDLSASTTGESIARARLAVLRGATGTRLHLIEGNHDRCSSIHRDGWKHQPRFLEVFDSVQAYARRRGPERAPVLMSHYPYASAGDGPGRGAARYLEYRLPDMGHWLCHGHTHQSERVSGPRSIHVGWDAWRRPVRWDEIETIIKEATR